MMKKKMLIQAFRPSENSTAMAKACSHLSNLSKQDRELAVSPEKSLTLDHINNDGHLWLMNFGLLKNRGPGISDGENPIRPGNIGLMNRYAHETAMLYRGGSKQVALIEFVQKGARVKRIADFFTNKMNADRETNYLFTPILLDNAKAIAKGKQMIQQIKVTAVPESLDSMPFISGLHEKRKIERGELNWVAKIEMIIKVKPKLQSSKKAKEHVREVVEHAEKGNLEKVIIVGRDNDDDDWELINILDPEQRLSQEVELTMDDDRETAPAEKRFEALKNALEEYDHSN